MSIRTPPELLAQHRQALALIEWLGLTPEDVSNLRWTVSEDVPPRKLCELPREPEAVIDFQTTPEAKPSRWTHSAGGMDQPTTWTLVLPASELTEVIGE